MEAEELLGGSEGSWNARSRQARRQGRNGCHGWGPRSARTYHHRALLCRFYSNPMTRNPKPTISAAPTTTRKRWPNILSRTVHLHMARQVAFQRLPCFARAFQAQPQARSSVRGLWCCQLMAAILSMQTPMRVAHLKLPSRSSLCVESEKPTSALCEVKADVSHMIS